MISAVLGKEGADGGGSAMMIDCRSQGIMEYRYGNCLTKIDFKVSVR
jgi:hypothetical protein